MHNSEYIHTWHIITMHAHVFVHIDVYVTNIYIYIYTPMPCTRVITLSECLSVPDVASVVPDVP